MSSSSAPLKKTFQLRVTGLPLDANLTLYDGWDQVAWAGTNQPSVDLSLPAGLYTLRGELAGVIKETAIRLDSNVSLVHTETAPLVPEQFTAAPLEGTALSHEYYRFPSADWSKNYTRPPIDTSRPSDASIFVFIRPRFAGDHPPGKDLAEELFLLNADGTVASSFAPSEIQSHSQDGWLALSAPAPHGFYSLEYRGSPARAMAVYLFSGWQTQIFILHHQRPLIEGMRIFLARLGLGFNPVKDDATAATDLALDFLQNGLTRVPQRMMDELLLGKFENPMLGLVAGYVLLRQPSPNSSLLNTVIMNLEMLLGPQVPDVNAIRALKAQALKEPPCVFQFQYPPMFRAGLEGVIRASLDQPELLPADSVIERIATELLADSPWSSWETVPSPSVELQGSSVDFLLEPSAVELELKTSETPLVATPKLDWVQSALLDALSLRVRRKKFNFPAFTSAQLGRTGADTSTPHPGLDLRQVALRLNVPERTVEAALEGLGANLNVADNYLRAQGMSGIRLKADASIGKSIYASADLSALFDFDINKTEL